MAIVKIIAIRDRLDKRVNYAINGEKTSLDAGITYAANPEKTEQHFFASAINCESCETAYWKSWSGLRSVRRISIFCKTYRQKTR